MMRFVRLAPLLALAHPIIAQSPADQLIPRPASITASGNTWRMPDTIRISTNRQAAVPAASLLLELLRSEHTRPARISTRGQIRFVIGKGTATDESYTLNVNAEGIVITAPSLSGLRWGAQSARQLIAGAQNGSIGGVEIRDQPRYEWRGAMLDVGRHWFPAADVLRWIDVMARYKLNVFHWHLSEDQGWRLAINRYPKLTSVGAWRNESADLEVGGFYSQADVRRVVAYAAARGITVVPEIEMPGHSRAALAAYPKLGCTGEQLPVPSGWGVFDDVLCPTEATFTFLEGVLTEVLELFPSHNIHIGGDEVPKRRWKECAECQAIIAREKLGDEEGLQRWFTARIATWLKAHGRRMIGWDEILNGGAPPGAMVQAWQGSNRIGVALAAGADVIASPAEWTYVNRPASPRELSLDRIVRFDPANPPIGTARVLGGEAPLWTERVVSPANVEMMYFPRLIGFAEVMWSGPADPAGFATRLAPEQARLERQGIAFGPANADLTSLMIRYDTTSHQLRLGQANLITGISTEVLHDGNPVAADTSGALFAQEGRFTLQLRRGTDAIGESRTVTVADHLARNKPVTFVTPADVRYPGTGAYTLTDGARGTVFADGLWNGWQGPDLDATIDLGTSMPLHDVSISLLEEVRSWILYPSGVRVQLSTDGSQWRDGGAVALNVPTVSDGRSRRLVTITLPVGSAARWVRVVATNPGKLPAWHPGAGSPSWIFADEIVVH